MQLIRKGYHSDTEGCLGSNGIRLLVGTRSVSYHLSLFLQLSNCIDIATSTDVEHLFLHGGLNVMKWHHNLSAELMIDQTVLNSWIKHPGLVNDDELMDFFSNKSKRPNNDGRKLTTEDD